MSTLPTQRPIDGTVPVVSSGGGKPSSYRDPKSPESIMLKVKRTQVQAEVDTKFDSNEPTHEDFRGGRFGRGSAGGFNEQYLLTLIGAGLLGLFFIIKERRRR